MLRVVLLTASLVAAPLAAPAPVAAKEKPAAKKCDSSEGRKRRNSALGGMLGGLANRAIGRTGLAGFVPTNTFATMLTDAIACKLDAQEQKQAAAATTQAVRGGVGSSASWQSETRAGVTGTSTVKAQTLAANGASCLDVTDVVIVSGEETTVSKRMCRAPGASGYTLSA